MLHGTTKCSKARHEAGEPLLPEKYVTAVSIIKKLYRRNFWGGTRNKNFMWLDLLARGGVHPTLVGLVPQVANDLTLHGLLRPKYGGGQKKAKNQKYALNGDRLAEIEEIVNGGVFSDQAVRRLLMRDKRLVPRSFLTWTSEDVPSQPPEQRADEE